MTKVSKCEKYAAVCSMKEQPLSKNSVTETSEALTVVSEVSTSSSSGNRVVNIDPSRVYKVPLIPLDCSFGTVTEDPHKTTTIQKMVRQNIRNSQRPKVTIVFAIRHPGCGACRFHGRQLSQLVQEDNSVTCAGIIKTAESRDTILELYQDYFKFPLYKDEKWAVYHAMGNRKVSQLKAVMMLPKMLYQFKKNKVSFSVDGGDAFTKGGLLIFDVDGNLRYTYYETYGKDLNMEQIREAVEEAKYPLEK